MLNRQQLDMYSIWRSKCIATMKDKLRLNVAARSKKLEEVVNDCIMNINKELQINGVDNELNRFQLSDNLILSSLEEMYNKLDSWNGVNISSCKKVPNSFDEYWYIADNWWNRYVGLYIYIHQMTIFLELRICTVSCPCLCEYIHTRYMCHVVKTFLKNFWTFHQIEMKHQNQH